MVARPTHTLLMCSLVSFFIGSIVFSVLVMNNGVLHYTMEETTTSISIVIGDKTLTLCGINNQQNLVLNKKE